jgi:hypothetical protein
MGAPKAVWMAEAVRSAGESFPRINGTTVTCFRLIPSAASAIFSLALLVLTFH